MCESIGEKLGKRRVIERKGGARHARKGVDGGIRWEERSGGRNNDEMRWTRNGVRHLLHVHTYA